MTIAALARAAGMQPSNLRRMLARTSATTRLGTVMRLLRPLRCHISPTGAHTSAELAAALDEERRRRGASWEGLLGPAAAHLRRDPERIPLDVVMRIASGLKLELMIADDADVEPHHGAPSGEPAAPGTADASRPAGAEPAQARIPPPRPRARRRRAATSSGRTAAASESNAPSAERPASPAPTQDTPAPASSPPTASASSSSTASAPSPGVDPFALGPLRPPRLGRYRDLPDQPRARPAPAPWKPQREKFALEETFAQQLADFSGNDWRDLLSLIWSGVTGVAAVPAHLFEGMGNMVAAGLARLRRPRPAPAAPPAAPEPPDELFDELDISALMPHWIAAHAPGYRPQDLYLHHDDRGLLVGHVALDKATMAAVRMAPRGHAHQLVNLLQQLPGGGLRRWLAKEVPLAITIGGERHVFRHIHAGPIFGEIVLEDRAYFLAAISALLVLVEVRGEAAKLVWGGHAEGLPRLALATPRPESPTAQTSEAEVTQATPDQAQTDVQVPQADGHLERERLAERLHRQAAEQGQLREQLEAVTGELGDERQRRLAAQHARAAVEGELETLRHELAGERQRREVLEHEQVVAMRVIDMARKAAEVLPAELAAQSAARERSATEARLATRMLEKTMEILVRHAPVDVAVEWKRQIVAALVDGRSDVGPEELEVVTRFAEQFIGAFGGARARQFDHDAELEMKPAHTSAAVPSAGSEPDPPGVRVRPGEVSCELQTPAAMSPTGRTFEPVTAGTVDSGDVESSPKAAPSPDPEAAERMPAAVDVPRDVEESGDIAATRSSSAPSPDRHAAPTRPGRMRQWSNWSLPDPVEATSKPPSAGAKVGRNDPCPCRSGKKFKKCCWRP